MLRPVSSMQAAIAAVCLLWLTSIAAPAAATTDHPDARSRALRPWRSPIRPPAPSAEWPAGVAAGVAIANPTGLIVRAMRPFMFRTEGAMLWPLVEDVWSLSVP